MDIIFIALSIATGLFCAFYGYAFMRGGLLAEKLPRMSWPAVVLGVPCLVWCAWHGCIMLEGPLAKFHPIVWIMVPVLAVLSWFFIDYLFARTSGGFFILAVNELLRRGFADSVIARPLYSCVCLVLGIAGLCMIGIPWRLRDAFTLFAGKKIGKIIAAVLYVFAFLLIIMPFF